MKIEKKLIVFSAVAIIIGIAAISPLMFFMTAKAETPKPWFSVEMPYAYCDTMDGPLNYSDLYIANMSVPDFTSSQPVVSHRIIIVLNLTLDANLKTETDDARFEYYQINITTDKETVETQFFEVGTGVNDSFAQKGFHFMQDGWFDTDKFDPKLGGGSGLYNSSWPTGVSTLWGQGGSGTASVGSSSVSSVVSALREAQTVYITLYRVGWASFKGNSTTVSFANNETICQIQLEKYGDGWLYNNNFIPADRLSQIDPWKPIVTDPKTGLPVPSVEP
jgi:hypothetical protein